MTSARTRRRNDAGVTLVELMIVLVFIAIGILALSGVQTRSSRDVDSGSRRVRALALAQNQIEITRAAGFSQAQSDSGQSGPFTWTTVVDTPSVDLARVRVTVTWTEKGDTSSVELDNLVANR